MTNLDAQPWVAEWTRLAEPWERQAAALEAKGRTGEARDAYLKAATYYSIAKFPVINHPAKRAAYRRCIELYLKAARYFDPPLERAAISFDLQRAQVTPSSSRGEGKEIIVQRPDLDGERIGIIGRSYGGYWGGKMAYVEPKRLKAAVQWGGPIHHTFQEPWLRQLQNDRLYLWSLLDSMIYAHNVKNLDELRKHAPTLSLKTQGWLDKPAAPLLGVNGAKDPWISVQDIDILLESGAAKAARVFPEGGHMGRGESGAGEVVIDWLRSQLSSSKDLDNALQAPSLPTVRAAMFGGEPPPLFAVAQQAGLFQKFGVRVVVETRWTSEELREGLAEDRFDVVHSLADNAVAVAEDLRVPVLILLGTGGGGAGTHLVAQPHIKSVADLRGATVLVDSPDTGHALALRKILRLSGLEAGRDYTMLPLGQTQKRFEAMQANKMYAATMMGFSEEARRLGFRSLGAGADLVGRYQVSAVYARKDWVEANPGAAVGYLAGYLYAGRWSRDPANKAAVIEALAKRSAPEVARQTYERTFSGGPEPEPTFDLEAFKNGLALRAEIQGTWGGTPPPPERYYDLSYYRQALALLKR